ncbi:MAG: GxxExxY protein [Phycisphaeraceae bacterium]
MIDRLQHEGHEEHKGHKEMPRAGAAANGELKAHRAIEALARDVIGAAIEVHRELGPGFPESSYERALSIELSSRNIRHACQHQLRVRYKGHDVGEGRIDLLVAEQLVVELKTVDSFCPIHGAQVVSYLRTTGLQLGLLLNFNTKVLKEGIRRIIL